jgi:hypothetical protein
VLGKDPADAKGIVTVEQLPGAIAAVGRHRRRQGALAEPPRPTDEDDAKPAGGGVSFFQRAVPLLELLERS